MPKKIPSKRERIRRADIKNFKKPIHEQSKEWLTSNFGPGRDYPVNISLLLRNIIWQLKEQIRKKERPPYEALIRSFWYSHIKPSLHRAESMGKSDPYKYLSDMMARLVTRDDIMRYKDIGFVDDNEHGRSIGINNHVILFSEKAGHFPLLQRIAGETEVTILALRGQSSVLSTEYFVDEMKEKGIDIRKSFYLFSLVDYSPWGWVIKDAFLRHLRFYGVRNVKVVDLALPEMLTELELELHKYRLDPKDKMNRKWMAKTKGVDMQFYGFEADAISPDKIKQEFLDRVRGLITTTEPIRKARNKMDLAQALEILAARMLRIRRR